ncbi:hypothetical protein D3C71_1327800 [compost metagenome]
MGVLRILRGVGVGFEPSSPASRCLLARGQPCRRTSIVARPVINSSRMCICVARGQGHKLPVFATFVLSRPLASCQETPCPASSPKPVLAVCGAPRNCAACSRKPSSPSMTWSCRSLSRKKSTISCRSPACRACAVFPSRNWPVKSNGMHGRVSSR